MLNILQRYYNRRTKMVNIGTGFIKDTNGNTKEVNVAADIAEMEVSTDGFVQKKKPTSVTENNGDNIATNDTYEII